MPSLFSFLAGGSSEQKADITYGPLQLWADMWGRSRSNAGVKVNDLSALRTTTVLACVRRISEAFMCPMKVYAKSPNGGREEATAHPLYDLLEHSPNSLQTGVEYRETVGLHLALKFNHYSYISRVGGKIDELLPIPPAFVTTKYDRKTSTMKYEVNWPDGGGTTVLDQEEVWHVRGPSWDGVVGMDAIMLLGEAIGLAIATEETHARFHANGAQPGGIVSTDKDLSDKQVRDRLKEAFNEYIGGVQNKFKTLVLDNGLKWESTMVNGVDSQHLQLRQFQVEEICRGFCVMPIMVGYSGDKAPTFASSEQLFLQHLVHTVRPWHRRVSGSADRWLLSKSDRQKGFYTAFIDADFMAPDMKTKAEYYKTALGGGGNPGWITPNQARGYEEMPNHPGGDNLYAPTNAGPIGPDGIPKVPKPAPAAKPPGDPNA